MALAVLAAVLGAAADSAVAQSDVASYFTDDDGSVHEPALEVLAARGVLDGIECGEGLICPGKPLKRWEMAVWLVRVLDGADPGPPDTPSFSDVDYDAWWAPLVDRLMELGVTAGCRRDPLQYCPDGAVSRAQMATFLKTAFDLEPAASAGFTDVDRGDAHAASIDALAASGVTAGCSRSPLRFCPAVSVTRGQMASFLASALSLIESPASSRFIAIDAGSEHTCGLRGDSRVVCWGQNSQGQADAPEGEFLAVSAGRDHSCAIGTDRTVTCWGADFLGQSDVPSQEFSALTAGSYHSCGLLFDGSVTCWGANDAGQSDAPDGQFAAVAAGTRHSCGLLFDGSVTCWGANDAGQSDAPDGEFVSLAVGNVHSCGIRRDGLVRCWGQDGHQAAENTPTGEMSQVSVGAHHSCGIRTSGLVYCWGYSEDGQAASLAGEFAAVAAGERHSCGLLSGGTVVCWGDVGYDPTDAPGGEFSALSSSRSHACGLRSDGSVSCWGNPGRGRSYPPGGAFVDVSAGWRHSCGVRAGGTVVCWGDSTHGQTLAPEGSFSAVSAGQVHSCGLLDDRSVACWGANFHGQSEAPEGHFRAVAAGSHHSCAVASGGAIVCWGLEDDRLEAPDGDFSAVTVGDAHSCGLRTNGSVSCWSASGSFAQAPDGNFSAIAAGYWHVCGIRTDSTVACWGDDSSGQSSPPDGDFRAITGGLRHSCGLRVGGGIVCWGAETVPRPPGVQPVSGPGLADPALCRPYGVSGATTAGFPRPHWAAPTTGPVRVAVLFLDFPDAPASHSTRREAELGLPFLEAYAESASYGLLDVQITPLHRWLRAEHGYAHYATGGIDAEAVRLADSQFDFSGHDIVMTVMPSSHFGGGVAFGNAKTEEGFIRLTVRFNVFPLPEPRQPFAWGVLAAHEFLHALGLLDMYPSDSSVHERADAPSGLTWIEARFGIMTLRGHFLAQTRDRRTAHVWRHPDGYESTAYSHLLDAREALAWSRWQLGWLDESQIRCVTEPSATVGLRPVADPGGGIAMAAIPLSAHEVIVIESRRRIGLDAGIDHTEPDGARTTFPGLATEGVLVYTVDASLPGGHLPVKLAGDTGNGQVEDYPTLSVGASVTLRGYTITVEADDGATHTVTITRVDDG